MLQLVTGEITAQDTRTGPETKGARIHLSCCILLERNHFSQGVKKNAQIVTVHMLRRKVRYGKRHNEVLRIEETKEILSLPCITHEPLNSVFMRNIINGPAQ